MSYIEIIFQADNLTGNNIIFAMNSITDFLKNMNLKKDFNIQLCITGLKYNNEQHAGKLLVSINGKTNFQDVILPIILEELQKVKNKYNLNEAYIKKINSKIKCRLANEGDLPKLEIIFKQIVKHMYNGGIKIWNDFYPFDEFPDDIKNKNLYLLINNEDIISVFGLYSSTNGQENFEWGNKNAKVFYLGRFAVNINYLNQGVGSLTLKLASEIVRKQNAHFLRLLVSNENFPALNLYRKNGFQRVMGEYVEFSEALHKDIVEFGFEKKL